MNAACQGLAAASAVRDVIASHAAEHHSIGVCITLLLACCYCMSSITCKCC